MRTRSSSTSSAVSRHRRRRGRRVGVVGAASESEVDGGDHDDRAAGAAGARRQADRRERRGSRHAQIYESDAPGRRLHPRRGRPAHRSRRSTSASRSQQGESTGLGLRGRRGRHILTNAHVVEGARSVTVQFQDKQTSTAKVLGTDESSDLAVLKVDPTGRDLIRWRSARPRACRSATRSIAIGNPFGLDRTLTTGVVSALQRADPRAQRLPIDNVSRPTRRSTRATPAAR